MPVLTFIIIVTIIIKCITTQIGSWLPWFSAISLQCFFYTDRLSAYSPTPNLKFISPGVRWIGHTPGHCVARMSGVSHVPYSHVSPWGGSYRHLSQRHPVLYTLIWQIKTWEISMEIPASQEDFQTKWLQCCGYPPGPQTQTEGTLTAGEKNHCGYDTLPVSHCQQDFTGVWGLNRLSCNKCLFGLIELQPSLYDSVIRPNVTLSYELPAARSSDFFAGWKVSSKKDLHITGLAASHRWVSGSYEGLHIPFLRLKGLAPS